MSWKKEISQIKLREKLAKQQGGPEAVKLQHNKGRLTLRERIDLLLDKESFFPILIVLLDSYSFFVNQFKRPSPTKL